MIEKVKTEVLQCALSDAFAAFPKTPVLNSVSLRVGTFREGDAGNLELAQFNSNEEAPFYGWTVMPEQVARIESAMKNMEILLPSVVIEDIAFTLTEGRIGPEVFQQRILLDGFVCLDDFVEFPISSHYEDVSLRQHFAMTYFHTWGRDESRESIDDCTFYGKISSPKAVSLHLISQNFAEPYMEEQRKLSQIFAQSQTVLDSKARMDSWNCEFSLADLDILTSVRETIENILQDRY